MNALQKLHAFARVNGIKVIKRKTVEEGWFSSYGRWLGLDPDLTGKELQATFLHELGHYMDSVLNPEVSEHPKLYEAYDKLYANGTYLNKRSKRQILASERRAWVYGRVVAKMLGIRLGKWYTLEMTDALEWYRSKGVKTNGDRKDD